MRKYKFLSLFLSLFLLYSWMVPAYAADSLHEADAVPAPPELTPVSYAHLTLPTIRLV